MFKIIVDSSIDVDDQYMKDIIFIGMNYTEDGKEFKVEHKHTDKEMIDFYKKMENGVVMKTTQITPYIYEEVFKKESKDSDVLYLCLSSGISHTYENAYMVSSELNEESDYTIEVVDTRGATGGIGLLLMKAIKYRDSGLSVQESAKKLREDALRVCYWFTVDDLMYLQRGGRVSTTTAVTGNLLSIKPILKFNDEGQLVSIGKSRGQLKTMKQIVSYYENSNEEDDVIIVHCLAHEKASKLKDMILDINPSANIQTCHISPIIGSHVGPGMYAIIHWGNRNYK